MPYINEDGSTDNLHCYILKCDNCGKVQWLCNSKEEDYNETGHKWSDLDYHLRYRVFSPWVKFNKMYDLLKGMYCYECKLKLIPYLHTLSDILEIDVFNNRLMRAINERKKSNKDNRSTA